MEANLTPKLSPVPPSTQGVDSSICMNNTDKSISCNHTKNALPNDIFKDFFLFFCENVIFHYLKKMFSIYLSWFTQNLLLLHYLYLFCCFLVKSQVTESFLPFSPILFCNADNMLPLRQPLREGNQVI